MASGKFNTIVIYDAIPDGEMNTALTLREQLRDIAAYKEENLSVRYAKVNTVQCLADDLFALTNDVKENGVLPSLHLDCHGFDDESGIATARGENCSWATLKEMITPLNVATGLNLMVLISACFGGSFAKAIRAGDRAPLWGLIGPTREVATGQLIDSFQSFYSTFFDEKPPCSPVTALNQGVGAGEYFMTTAQQFFYAVWVNYKLKQCTPEKLGQRALEIEATYLRNGQPSPGVAAIRQAILGRHQRVFEESCAVYFMYDLFPEYRELFPVTFEEGERQAVEAGAEV